MSPLLNHGYVPPPQGHQVHLPLAAGCWSSSAMASFDAACGTGERALVWAVAPPIGREGEPALCAPFALDSQCPSCSIDIAEMQVAQLREAHPRVQQHPQDGPAARSSPLPRCTALSSRSTGQQQALKLLCSGWAITRSSTCSHTPANGSRLVRGQSCQSTPPSSSPCLLRATCIGAERLSWTRGEPGRQRSTAKRWMDTGGSLLSSEPARLAERRRARCKCSICSSSATGSSASATSRRWSCSASGKTPESRSRSSGVLAGSYTRGAHDPRSYPWVRSLVKQCMAGCR
jgi:hypothetical protein